MDIRIYNLMIAADVLLHDLENETTDFGRVSAMNDLKESLNEAKSMSEAKSLLAQKAGRIPSTKWAEPKPGTVTVSRPQRASDGEESIEITFRISRAEQVRAVISCGDFARTLTGLAEVPAQIQTKG